MVCGWSASSQVIALSNDHKPNLPTEKQRILQAGGTVDYLMGIYRVNSCLAVARAFGDATLKPFGVTALPEVLMSVGTVQRCRGCCFV
jgi:serine/threonine protein phosphatase PrpC